MNKNLTIAAMFVVAILIAFFVGRTFTDLAGGANGAAGSGDREILYWVASMDPN